MTENPATKTEEIKMQALKKIINIEPEDGYQIVTPTTAAHWLNNFNYEHQRKLRQYHVSTLANEMTAGRFRNRTQINFCEFGGRYFLTNGQHTLNAIVTSQVSCELSVIVLSCSSMSEVADDFSRHDTHLTRQMADSLVAHEIDQQLDVTKTELNWISAACFYYMYMLQEINTKARSQISHDVKLEAVMKYGELAKSALHTINEPGAKGKTFLVRKTTLACAMFVYNSDSSLCDDFYGEISRDDGLKRGDPRKALLEYMRDTTTTGGGYYAKSAKKSAPDHILVKSQATAFNAYIERRDLKIIKTDRDARKAKFKGIGELYVG